MQVDTHNKEFQDALNLIQYTRQSVFLTGKAGTGKSTFLKYVCEVTKKKHIVLLPQVSQLSMPVEAHCIVFLNYHSIHFCRMILNSV